MKAKESGAKKEDMDLWHRRLGHSSSVVVNKLFHINKKDVC